MMALWWPVRNRLGSLQKLALLCPIIPPKAGVETAGIYEYTP
jgi:hypothetical protein